MDKPLPAIASATPSLAPARASDVARKRARQDVIERSVHDQLPLAFPCDPSEAEWLGTLLTADELRYVFEGGTPK
jgi:hypothetical protein